MTTPHITIDTRWSIGIIIGLLAQIVAFARFVSKMDSRVEVLENQSKQTNWYPYSDGKLMEQKLDFFLSSMNEIKTDIKDIKQSLK